MSLTEFAVRDPGGELIAKCRDIQAAAVLAVAYGIGSRVIWSAPNGQRFLAQANDGDVPHRVVARARMALRDWIDLAKQNPSRSEVAALTKKLKADLRS